MQVRYERTVKEPPFKAGVEGETKDLPQHVAVDLAAEGYVTLLEKPVPVPTAAEVDAAEAAHNAAIHAASLTQGETDGTEGEDQGDE